jgi:hypothetical protein
MSEQIRLIIKKSEAKKETLGNPALIPFARHYSGTGV